MKDAYYDSIAQGYDELYGEEQRKKAAIIRENISINHDSRILDIGCGTGISSDFDCEVVGIDPSEELIKIAKEKDKHPKHEFIVGKAEELDKLGFMDNDFDYVISVSALHHFKDLESVLKEAKRIGKSFVLTVRKKSSSRKELISKINSILMVRKEIEEDKDIILFCSK